MSREKLGCQDWWTASSVLTKRDKGSFGLCNFTSISYTADFNGQFKLIVNMLHSFLGFFFGLIYIKKSMQYTQGLELRKTAKVTSYT